MININRGSGWRKWDLHVHTPFSIEQHYGDSQSDDIWEEYIKDLEGLPSEFKVLGINDYLFIDGYKKVLEYKKNGRLSNIDLLLPVIELRIDKFGSIHSDDPFKRVNFHVIFSDKLDADVIKAQFLDALNSEYKLFADCVDNADWGGVITRENLINLGQKLIDSSDGKITGSPLKIGFNSLNIPYSELLKKLENPLLKGKYLTAVGKTEWDAMRWESSPAEKKSVINKSDFVFTASESIDNFYKAKSKLTEQNVNDLLLDCSDAHHYSDKTVKDKIGNCFTWIKADTTFEGLKQVLNEPTERVYIGDIPEVHKRVNENRTKYISSLKVNQVEGYSENEGVWFKDVEVFPSYELTAIIGNKGKGKSALTDIIGLCGNSHNQEYFSFLDVSKKKFKKQGLAKNFEASLIWVSNDVDTKNLDDNTDKNAVEKVKYLPQSYFETLCNNIENNQEFEAELNDVVFRHIPLEERLGKTSFDEFLNEKRKRTKDEIDNLSERIEVVNKDIVTLQNKDTEEYKNNIDSKIKILEADLKSHEESKPENPYPNEEENNSKEEANPAYKALTEKRQELDALNQQKTGLLENLEKLNTEIEELESSKNRIVFKKQDIENFKAEERTILDTHSINIDTVFPSPVIDITPIEKLIENKKKEKQKIIINIGKGQTISETNTDEEKGQLWYKIELVSNEIDGLSKNLDDKEKSIEDYKENLKKWEQRKKEILGDSQTPAYGTLNAFKIEKEYITNELKTDIETKQFERLRISKSIYEQKNTIIEILNIARESINNVLDDNSEKIEKYDISIDASFELKSFFKNFLEYIDKGRIGYFKGIDDSIKKLKELFQDTVLDDEESFFSTIENVITKLNEYNPFDQIRDNKELEDLYNYVYSLGYLNERYELKFSGKSIQHLSPGERGASLIVFYLLLDNDNIPLIIDQPEDNLDNQSVYEVLVPFIKYAKKNRQLIIVTHNPNLAIVADAEQVIHVDIDKESNNQFSFKAGGIESQIINDSVVRVLEGTMPAFNKRKSKYYEK